MNPIKTLNAYFNSSNNDTIEVEISNLQPFPIKIISIEKENNVYLPNISNSIITQNTNIKTLQFENIKFIKHLSNYSSQNSNDEIILKYRILGSINDQFISVNPWSRVSNKFNDNIKRNTSNDLSDYEFIVLNYDENIILFKNGNWVLNKDLIIPSGYTVLGYSGLKIDLRKSSKIIFYSPIKFLGSKNNPIIITSTDSSGQGIGSFSTKSKSLLNYVYFKNLSIPRWLQSDYRPNYLL
jgi:hypothetical protein